MSYFVPAQPLLTLGALALLAEALRRRPKAFRLCRVTPAAADSGNRARRKSQPRRWREGCPRGLGAVGAAHRTARVGGRLPSVP
jgi:hypothetical protein